MQNLKKRILSFVSAAAMVATMIPTAVLPSLSLFASAATDTIQIEAEDMVYYNTSMDTPIVQTKVDDNYGAAQSGNWLMIPGGGKGEAYLPVTIPSTASSDTTYTLKLCYATGGYSRNIWVNIWSQGSGDETITINGTTYYKKAYYGELNDSRNSQFSGGPRTVANSLSLTPGKTYYVGLYGENYAGFDYIQLIASEEVFDDSSTTDNSSTNDDSSSTEETVTETVWSGSQSLGNWDKKVTIAASALSDYESISKITVTYANGGDNAQIQLCGGSANGFIEFTDLGSSGTYKELLTPSMSSYVLTNGIEVKGQNLTIKEVKVTGVKYSGNTYTLTTEVENNVGGTITGGGTYREGKTVTLTATAADGYRARTWWLKEDNKLTAIGQGSTLTYTMPGNDVTIVHTFEKVYTAEAKATTGGTATVSASLVNKDTSVTFTAKPKVGYSFVGWQDENGESVSTKSIYITKLTDNTVLTAIFKLDADAYVSSIEMNYTAVEKYTNIPIKFSSVGSDSDKWQCLTFIEDDEVWKAKGDYAEGEALYPFTIANDGTDVTITAKYSSSDLGVAYLNLWKLNEEGKLKKVGNKQLSNGSSWDSRTDSLSYSGLAAGDYYAGVDVKAWAWVSDVTVESTNGNNLVRKEQHTLTASLADTSAGRLETGLSDKNYASTGYSEEISEGDVFVIVARAKSDKQFDGWYDTNENLVSYNARYEVEMGKEDITLVARFSEKSQEIKDAEKTTIIKGTETPNVGTGKGFNNEGAWYYGEEGYSSSNDDPYTTNKTKSRLDITSVPDAVGVITHNVWKIDYDLCEEPWGMNAYGDWGTPGAGAYAGYYEAKNSSTVSGFEADISNLQGFTFWYRTDPEVGADQKFIWICQSNAFSRPSGDHTNGGIAAFLPGTSGIWTKVFIQFDDANVDQESDKVKTWDMYVNQYGYTSGSSSKDYTITNLKGSFYIADLEGVVNDTEENNDGTGTTKFNWEYIFKDQYQNTIKTETYYVEASYKTVNDTKYYTYTDHNGVTHKDVLESEVKDYVVSPEYIQHQGYTWNEWEYTHIATGTVYTLDHEDVNNTRFRPGVHAFLCKYTLDPGLFTVTVNGGKLYANEEEGGTDYNKIVSNGAIDVSYHGKVRITADSSKGTFQYWTLNGQIYSYEKEFYFSAWCDADFVAYYGEEADDDAVAYIEKTVHLYGYDNVATTIDNRITYDVAFYVPEGSTLVGAGIIYAPRTTDLTNSNLNSNISVSNGTMVVNYTYAAVIPLLSNQLATLENGYQYTAAILGTKGGKTRCARSYVIYKDSSGNYQYVLSDIIAIAYTPSVDTTVTGDDNVKSDEIVQYTKEENATNPSWITAS